MMNIGGPMSSGLAAIHLAAYGVLDAGGNWILPETAKVKSGPVQAPPLAPPPPAMTAPLPNPKPVVSKHVPVSAAAATTPDGWRAEWNASARLRQEFTDVGDYVALKAAEATGRVRLLAPGLAAPPPNGITANSTPDGWRAEYRASAALQREFRREEFYIGFKRADAARRARPR